MVVIVKDGWTPSYIACLSGNVAVLDWMVSHGLPSSEITRASKRYILMVDSFMNCGNACNLLVMFGYDV